MKTVLVTGASGMAGVVTTKYFETAGWKVRALVREDFDIGKDPFSKFEALAEGVECIVNCAGVIKPMIAKTPIEAVIRVNSVFPRNLSHLAKARKIPCFHLTTDCVYTGNKGGYTENDYFDADDVYGMSKNAGEPVDCMTLRTSIIGEERGQGRSLIAWAQSQKGKTVNGFTNHRWNGVTTLYFAQLVNEIVRKGLYREGIFHLHSPDIVTKAELLRILDDVYCLNLKITSINAEQFCDRSLASVHPLSKQLAVKPIKQQVLELRDFFQKQLPQ